jgi:hypothetical protein
MKELWDAAKSMSATNPKNTVFDASVAYWS